MGCSSTKGMASDTKFASHRSPQPDQFQSAFVKDEGSYFSEVERHNSKASYVSREELVIEVVEGVLQNLAASEAIQDIAREKSAGTTATPDSSISASSSRENSDNYQWQPSKSSMLPPPHLPGNKRVIAEKSGEITDFYELERRGIGEGAYGFVSKASNIASGAVVAVKAIKRQKSEHTGNTLSLIDRLRQARRRDKARIKQEVENMKMLDHPNIVRLFETFEDERFGYLVLEFCAGGDFFDIVGRHSTYTEHDVAVVMQQVLNATAYMHRSWICHRDLKPDNVLFLTKHVINRNTVKVADFGLSCAFHPGEEMREVAGTSFYIAPQVLAGRYDNACDLWSCGVMAYMMLSGRPPFDGETEAKILSLVRRGNYTFAPTDWSKISDGAKNLIRQLLQMNIRRRYTAEQALDDVWVKDLAPDPALEFCADGQVAAAQLQQAHHRLRHFRQLQHNRAAAAAAAAAPPQALREAAADTSWASPEALFSTSPISKAATVFGNERRRHGANRTASSKAAQAASTSWPFEAFTELLDLARCVCKVEEGQEISDIVDCPYADEQYSCPQQRDIAPEVPAAAFHYFVEEAQV